MQISYGAQAHTLAQTTNLLGGHRETHMCCYRSLVAPTSWAHVQMSGQCLMLMPTNAPYANCRPENSLRQCKKQVVVISTVLPGSSETMASHWLIVRPRFVAKWI